MSRSRRRAGIGSAALVLCAVPCALAAQEGEPPERAGRGFFEIGYMAVDADPLNDALVEAGYSSLDDRFLTLGGGGWGGRGRVLLGGEGHALVETDETTAGGERRLRLGGGYGLFRVGVIALQRNRFDLIPAAGIGAGGMSLRIARRDAPTFDEVLADPDRGTSLATGGFLLDGALAATYRFRGRADDERERGGFILGLRVGYTLAPGDWDWSVDGDNDVAQVRRWGWRAPTCDSHSAAGEAVGAAADATRACSGDETRSRT